MIHAAIIRQSSQKRNWLAPGASKRRQRPYRIVSKLESPLISNIDQAVMNEPWGAH